MSEYRVDEYDSRDYDRHGRGPRDHDREPPTDVIRVPGRPRRRSAFGRALQALSGAITAGLVLLALVVVVTAWLGSRRGFPGPGAVSVTVHVVAAVVAVFAQRFADHRRGVSALSGSVVVFFVTVGVLWTQWWS